MIPAMPRKPEITRRSLLESAAREFARQGYEATGLAALTSASGLTKGALFHHFPGKEALAVAVINEILDPAIERRWLEPLARSESPVDTLKEILQSIATEITRGSPPDLPGPLSPLAPWLAVTNPDAPALRARVATAHARWRDAIADSLRRGRDAGTVHPAAVPAHEADFFLGWFHGTSLVLASEGDLPRSAPAFQAALAYLETLRPATS